MHLLITGADSLLARTLIAALPADVTVRAVDAAFSTPLPSAETRTGHLCDTAFLAAILADITHIIHLAPLYTRLADDNASLDEATRGSYQLANAAAAAGVQRLLLGSTLDFFAPLWEHFRADESWRPRPQPVLDQLCPWLAEVALREVARVTNLTTLCLRLGEVVDDAHAASHAYDRRWLHVKDGVAALLRGLEVEAEGWRVWHIGAAGERTRVPVAQAGEEAFGYRPRHDFAGRWASEAATSPFQLPTPIPARPIRKVVVFGAGGPLGAALAEELAPHYTVRLTDVKPVEELMAIPPQSPHEWRVVDVRDAAQVHAACAGMDAIVNVSVVRHDPVDAFRVNAVGAYNVMQAAVAHGIQRVVHTGPFMLGQRGGAGYDWDTFLVDDIPPRPGVWWVYLPSKLLGQEICRIFAEHYGLCVPTLTFAQFVNPALLPKRISTLAVSWMDAANAIRCALAIDGLPSPYEYMHIGADTPLGVFPNEKAKRLLNWQPRDRFEEVYTRIGS
jgi:nucleoside-diphosphate-sugar epimerase